MEMKKLDNLIISNCWIVYFFSFSFFFPSPNAQLNSNTAYGKRKTRNEQKLLIIHIWASRGGVTSPLPVGARSSEEMNF